jgi:hypothetical protein
MATKATIPANGYLNGYPQKNGNHNKVVLLLNGPTDYDAGGVLIDGPFAHVKNIHEIQVNSTSALYNVYVVVATANPVFLFSDIKLFFIDVATGLQPADNTNLSAIKVRCVVEGN